MLFYLQCLFAQTEESKERMINIMSKNIFMLVRGPEFIMGGECGDIAVDLVSVRSYEGISVVVFLSRIVKRKALFAIFKGISIFC